MGLDQTIRVVFENDKGEDFETYLRKVNSLQGYFERKYQLENNQEISISEDDVDFLIKTTDYILANNEDLDYIEKHFPPTAGFFYGNNGINEMYYDDVKGVNSLFKTLTQLDNVKELLYSSWY